MKNNLKKISLLFAFSLAITLFPALAGSSGSSAQAACTWNATNNTCSGTPTSPKTTFCNTYTTSAECTTETALGVQATASANDNAFVTSLCNVLKIATGNGGKAFAAFAIISLGIGFFTGKVSWGLMLGVAAGIAAMFGAPTIVAAIAGGDAFKC